MQSINRSVVLALGVLLLPVHLGFADEALYDKVAPSTAVIYKGEGPLAGAGTGFLIDAQERLVVTARHVVENLQGGMASSIYVIFAQSKDGAVITEAGHYRNNWQAHALRASVAYESVRRDLAILHVDKLPAGIKALPLAASPARPGQLVHLVGNSSDRFGALFSYCQGHVRNVFTWDELGARVVTTQLPANKGDSGGPMVNNLGQVVGFASMSTTGGVIAKTSVFHETQVTELSVCVTEIRAALDDMRRQRLAKGSKPALSPRLRVFAGEARDTTQLIMLDRDVMYRLLVKAEGFVPEMRIDGILVPVTAQPQGKLLSHLFAPKETKGYRIQVGHWPGRDLGKGPFRYTLTVDQVTFESDNAFKDAELKVNEHVRRFEAGKAYDIVVRAKGFEPDAQVVDGTKAVLTKFNYGNRTNTGAMQGIFEAVGLAKTEYETTMRFVAGQTKDYRILIAVSPYSQAPTGALDYTLKITEQKLLLSVNDQFDGKEPTHPRAGPFKIHTVKLEAGKSYWIDLLTTAFDSRLLLEDAAGNVVMEGFDATGFNASLAFRPTKTDTYRVVATSHQPGARGAYTVTVAESSDAPPGPPRTKKEAKE